MTVRDPVCRATSSPANIPSGRPRKPPPKVANMLIKETSLRYRDTTTPSRLRIDPFPLSLSLSLSPCVSRFRRLVRNPEIAHAHRRATSSTISDGTSFMRFACFSGGKRRGMDFDRSSRPKCFPLGTCFAAWLINGMMDKVGKFRREKRKRIISWCIESVLSLFLFFVFPIQRREKYNLECVNREN